MLSSRYSARSGKRGSAIGVEPVNRLHESETRDLQEIVERLVGAAVPARELARKRQESFDELLARLVIFLLLPAPEQRDRIDPLRNRSRCCVRPLVQRLWHFRTS